MQNVLGPLHNSGTIVNTAHGTITSLDKLRYAGEIFNDLALARNTIFFSLL